MTEVWHQQKMRVQYKDTDQMGVVHHGNYVTWFEVGRLEWIRHYGMSYQQIEEIGLLLPVVDVHVTYKKSAHFDDCVAIFTKLTALSPVRLEFYYEVRQMSEETFHLLDSSENVEPSGELLAQGETKHMWVNSDWKPARLNRTAPEIYQALENLL